MEDRKKILLFAYTKVNLGDNLFIYMLLKKYPNIDFYIHIVEKEYEQVYKVFPNMNYIYTGRNLDEIDIEEFDAYLYVGGSIFMESEYGTKELKDFNKFIKKCKEQGKSFFYMSCNFGPYKTQEYLDLARETFSLCDGICFRDKKSYDLFSDINSVMYSPDMAFSFKFDSKIEKEKKSIGISVINLEIRENLKHLELIYNDFIKRIIIKFAKRNYKVYLFSFSEFEKDGEAIDNIVNTVPEQYRDNISKVIFDKDVDDFLKKYSKMEYMVSGRFHSMILSILFGQKIYNLTYSPKQDNVIKELKLFNKYQRIEDLKYETILRKYFFKKVNKYKLNKIIKESEKQFLNLDKWISNS